MLPERECQHFVTELWIMYYCILLPPHNVVMCAFGCGDEKGHGQVKFKVKGHARRRKERKNWKNEFFIMTVLSLLTYSYKNRLFKHEVTNLVVRFLQCFIFSGDFGMLVIVNS